MLNRLVDRLGRTGFAALTSLIWALPMAAWAGSSDLSPIDKTAYPRIALTIGAVMFVVWLGVLVLGSRAPVTPRPRRFDLAQMSGGEKRWTLATIAFLLGVIAWLNAAATVDWAPLVSGVGEGQVGPVAFAAALLLFLAIMVAGAAISWRRAGGAYRRRLEA